MARHVIKVCSVRESIIMGEATRFVRVEFMAIHKTESIIMGEATWCIKMEFPIYGLLAMHGKA